ncbi:MAG TPA: hypothetical protein VHU40_16215 [Polyangia bacterium]|nr:hypothetical protein [Polyangia bacterium]
MKLLIVAGPYEADRIRKAAVSAGIEAVAVEPGESLSGWITATRPEVIVLAPQVISAEPVAALAKVRAVPRGRVPILLVGDADEEEALRPLADGFFVRPIAADDLIQQARVAMTDAAARPQEDSGSGPHASDSGRILDPAPDSGARSGKSPVLKPLMPAESAEEGVHGDASVLTREVPRGALTDAIPDEIEVATRASRTPRPQRLASSFDRLSETIDADIDADLEAELRDVVRVVGGLRKASRASKEMVAVADAPEPPPARAGDAAAAAEALNELTDESSQKTREVLQIGPDGEKGGLRPPVAPLAAPGDERDEAADRAAVQARYALVEDGDYFQILGVSRETGADEIRRAAESLLSRLASPVLHPSVAAELAEPLKEIRVVVGEAVRLLVNDRLRAQYRAHLSPGPAAPV